MSRNAPLIRLSVTCAALAGFIVAAGVTLAPVPFISTSASAAEGIRVPTDECFWDNFGWDEMQPAEQKAWSALGWTGEMWDSDDETAVPASDSKEWAELNDGERASATDLGIPEDVWDGDIDC
jgi:hypothetical protein